MKPLPRTLGPSQLQWIKEYLKVSEPVFEPVKREAERKAA